jgi:hypothetical protein
VSGKDKAFALTDVVVQRKEVLLTMLGHVVRIYRTKFLFIGLSHSLALRLLLTLWIKSRFATIITLCDNCDGVTSAVLYTIAEVLDLKKVAIISLIGRDVERVALATAIL